MSLGFATRSFERVLHPGSPLPPPAVVETLRRRFLSLLEEDLDNAERGVYPRELLNVTWSEYLRVLPEAIADAPRIFARVRRGNFTDLPPVAADRYPSYYLRNFHWQTDGWFSRRSARLYDFSVELLFGGTADVMRRMALPPVAQALRDRGHAQGEGARVLDIACGTGRFLRQLHGLAPKARLYGVDLSPPYIDQARALLSDIPDLTLLADNAESLPFRAELFDVVTSVFLFHELPKDVRRRVAREAFRVLVPGGTFVVNDSAQLSESSEIAFSLESFQRLYHEPYYKGYLSDDLAQMLAECGFEVLETRPHLVSKVVTARRPASAAS